MTSIGTGYDLSNSVFSPDGRNFQVEYAVKAVENGGSAIGIKCKDGVILAVEKIITSKLLKPNANKRIATVDRNIGIVSAGLIPDGRHFASRARDEAAGWRSTYKAPIPTAVLAARLGGYAQAYTLYSSVRPFGVTSIVAGWDDGSVLPVDGQVGSGVSGGGKEEKGEGKESERGSSQAGGPALYMIEPSGLYWGYYGAATGKGRQAAKAELEKLALTPTSSPDGETATITLVEGVRAAAKIILVAHEDNKDKDFELEMTWISGPEGPTRGRHVEVPREMVDEALARARKELEGEEEEEEGQGGETAE